MFDNIGGKIKGLAKAIFIIMTIAFEICAIVFLSIGEVGVIVGLLTIPLGPLVAWISSWFLYGFGELIDKATEIAENTRGEKSTCIAKSSEEDRAAAEKARTEKLANLFTEGLISEEEYRAALSKKN